MRLPKYVDAVDRVTYCLIVGRRAVVETCHGLRDGLAPVQLDRLLRKDRCRGQQDCDTCDRCDRGELPQHGARCRRSDYENDRRAVPVPRVTTVTLPAG